MRVMGVKGLTLYHLKSHLQVTPQLYYYLCEPNHVPTTSFFLDAALIHVAFKSVRTSLNSGRVWEDDHVIYSKHVSQMLSKPPRVATKLN